MKFLNIAVVLACSLFVFSCKDDPVASPTTGTIKGIVRDAITGKPIYNVDVQTTPPSESVSTDSLGQYTITAKEGNYSITASKTDYLAGTVSVRVTNGSTTTANISLSSISSKNNPPTTPVAVSPLDGDTSAGKAPQIQWSCTDPDSDPIKYTVYFDTANPPIQQVADSLTTQTFKLTGLKDSTFYYWKIVAKDRFGATSASPVFSFRTAGTYVPAVVDGLVAYLSFDETVNDAQGILEVKGNPDIQYVTGVKNKTNGAIFMGSNANSYLRYTSSTKLDLPATFTLCAWVKPERMPNSYTQLVGRWSLAGGSNNATYSLTLAANGKIAADTHDGTTTTQIITDKGITSGIWSHVVMTRAVDGLINVYINGESVGSIQSVPPQKSTLDLTIGRYSDTMGEMLYGAIDNVRIYSRALTLQEISVLWASGL